MKLYISLLALCFVSSEAFPTGKDIPKEYQLECGTPDDRKVGLLQICDKRTQLCSDAVMLSCQNCADDVCAFAEGKDPVDTAKQCRALCPLYWEKLQAEDFCDTCADKCGTSDITNTTTTSGPERSQDDPWSTDGLIITVIILCVLLVLSLTVNVAFVVLFHEKICIKLDLVAADREKRQKDAYVGLAGIENPNVDEGVETPEITMDDNTPTCPQYTAANDENRGTQQRLAPGQVPHHTDATHSPGLSSRHQFMETGDQTFTKAS